MFHLFSYQTPADYFKALSRYCSKYGLTFSPSYISSSRYEVTYGPEDSIDLYYGMENSPDGFISSVSASIYSFSHFEVRKVLELLLYSFDPNITPAKVYDAVEHIFSAPTFPYSYSVRSRYSITISQYYTPDYTMPDGSVFSFPDPNYKITLSLND